MPSVRTICADALIEIGVYESASEMSAAHAERAKGYFQRQLDAWQADRLTLSLQGQTAITWPSATSTQTIGPVGADVTLQRPVWINSMTYVIPGTSPPVETIMGPMNEDQYAQLTIKQLQSGLPQQYFYQVNVDGVLGTLFIWPQPVPSLTLQLYVPKAIDVPATLDDIVTGPPGYAEAFHYELAIRLLTPFGVPASSVPLLVGPTGLAARAFRNMKRPNVDPGLLGVDPALVSQTPGGYNVLSDQTSAPSVR